MEIEHLRPIVTELRAWLNVLPGIDRAAGDISRQRERQNAATRRLANYLRTTRGAQVTETDDGTTRITMAGLTATSVSGLRQALNNWLDGAERRIRSEQQEEPR